MRFLGYLLMALGGTLALGGISIASEPSVHPIATVIGAFAFPAIFLLAGYRLAQRGKKPSPPTDRK